MSDEGMGRPQDLYEELHDPAPPYTYEVPVPYGYQAMELDFDVKVPLNAWSIVMEHLANHAPNEKAVARVMTTAVILYWSTGEGTDMAECLWKARELERETRP